MRESARRTRPGLTRESQTRSYPRRRAIRLRGYDYTQQGAYFVTICTWGRLCALGDVVDSEMVLSDAGQLAQAAWQALPQALPGRAPGRLGHHAEPRPRDYRVGGRPAGGFETRPYRWCASGCGANARPFRWRAGRPAGGFETRPYEAVAGSEARAIRAGQGLQDILGKAHQHRQEHCRISLLATQLL